MEQELETATGLLDAIWSIITSIPVAGGEWLINELTNNDFLIATLVPAILVTLWYTLRSTGRFVTKYFQMLVTSELTFNSDNDLYHGITEFLYATTISKMFQRFFTLSYSWEKESLILTIGYGTSFGFIGRYPVIIKRSVEESQSAKFKETVTITFIGGKRKAIAILMKNLENMVERYRDGDNVPIYQMDKDGDMMRVASKPHRSLDTVLIPEEDKAYIIDKMDQFMNSEEYYVSKGLPYHLGIILSGPPGTGKTSLIHALASHYNRSICFSEGGRIRIGGIDLKNTMLVIEDIDVSGLSVAKRSDDPDATPDSNEMFKSMAGEGMSQILNFLDGLLSPHGLITIATTNRYDALDPAITRPGRFDVHLEFTNMKWPEWVGLCTLLDRVSPVEEEQYQIISPAQARYILLYYSDEEIIEYFSKPIVDTYEAPSVVETASAMGSASPSPSKRPRRSRY